MKCSAKVRWPLLFLLAFVLSASVGAGEVELYRKWVKSGSTIKVGDTRLTVSWNDPVMLVKVSEQYLSLENNTCDTVAPLRVCLNGTRFLVDGEIVPSDIHTTDALAEMYVIVHGLVAEVNLSRSYSTKRLVPGEETTVSVRFQNAGRVKATEVQYSDEYSDSFSVHDVVGCTLSGTTLSWEGTLHLDQQVTCRYVVKALKDTRYNAKAGLSYFNGIEKKTKTLVDLLEVIKNPLQVELKLNTSRIVLGDNFTLGISLENTHNDTLQIDRLELLPTGVRQWGTPTLYEGALAAGETMNLSVGFEANMTGEHNLTLVAGYEANGAIQSYRTVRRAIVTSDLDVSFVDGLDSLIVGLPARIRIEVVNPSTKREIYQVSASITSTLPAFPNATGTADWLSRKNGFTLIDTEYVPSAAGQFTLNISARYRSVYGEEFVKEDVRKVTVLGPSGSDSPADGAPGEPAPNASVNPEQKSRIALPNIDTITEDQTRVGGLLIIGGVAVAGALLLYLKFKVQQE